MRSPQGQAPWLASCCAWSLRVAEAHQRGQAGGLPLARSDPRSRKLLELCEWLDDRGSGMSEETPKTEQPTTTVPVAYEDASRLITSAGSAQLVLFSNVYRDPVRLDGVLKHPLRIREALSTLHAIVGSDYRYVPKDRTAYLAYLRERRESAAMSVQQAQRAFLEWALRNDPLAFILLDPVVT